MTAPKHLWSGDWELESSAHADDLATRRANPPANPEPEPPTEPAAPRHRPTRPTRPTSQTRPTRRRLSQRLAALRIWTRRRLRVILLAGILILAVAGAGYAVISNKGNSQHPQPIAQTGSEPWLGVELASAPIRGALVAKVVPGSPAAAAGIRPGDVITQLDTEPIEASATFSSAISGMQPGETVDIELQRGATEHTVRVALASRPLGTP